MLASTPSETSATSAHSAEPRILESLDRRRDTRRERLFEQREREHREGYEEEYDAGEVHDDDEHVHDRALPRGVRAVAGRGERLDDDLDGVEGDRIALARPLPCRQRTASPSITTAERVE